MLDAAFGLAGAAVMVGWGLLAVLPRWRGVAQVVAAVVVPSVLALAYLVLIMLAWHGAAGGFGSLAEVRALLASPPMLLAGWLHYLAFDLFVGAWIVRRARLEAIAHVLVLPLLLLTFLFGPVGFLGFQALRGARWLAARRGGAWGRFAVREPALVAAGLLLWAALLPTLLALPLDPRSLAGVPIWLKPAKFALSLGLYALTMAAFLPLASPAFRRSIAGRFVVWATILPSVLELSYIAWRASRGEASHFNVATPAAAAGYTAMGAGALILTLTPPVLAWGIARGDAPPSHPVVRLGVVLGLLLTFALGGLEGVILSAAQGHFVGQPGPGAASVPVFGWSLAVGDLRVAHFLGLHAQQIVPLIGVVAAWLFGVRGRAVLIGLTALYAALVVATFLQAVAGQPL